MEKNLRGEAQQEFSVSFLYCFPAQVLDKWMLKHKDNLLYQLPCSFFFLPNVPLSQTTNNFSNEVLCLSVTNPIVQIFVFTIEEFGCIVRTDLFVLVQIPSAGYSAEIIFLFCTALKESSSCILVG